VHADLFGSFAESTCAALVLSSVTPFGHDQQLGPMLYPLLLSAGMLMSCLVTTVLATDIRPATSVASIEPTLKVQVSVCISTVLAKDRTM
jgi:Na+/H+-translocating membrane pyrophosphatase